MDGNIVVAGASGYIGTALAPLLRKTFPKAKITLLSRSEQTSQDAQIVWKRCDLFSLKELEACVSEQVSLAYYLVHSMGPTAHLDQGSFADYDLILADNFGRVMKRKAVKQAIYLGGLIPAGNHAQLSLHLRSRWEVEECFRAHALPMTVFRAGIIVGDGGSSTQILLKLVNRLPLMICPSWTQTVTSPIDLDRVLKALIDGAKDLSHLGKVYDLAGSPPLTYVDIMRDTSKKLGKTRRFLTVPVFTPWLSRLWVSVVTNTPRNLVYPLIQSLAHPMIARPTHAFPSLELSSSFKEMIKSIPLAQHARGTLFPFKPRGKRVRSVQRLPLPIGKNAEWVKDRYLQWLPRFLRPWIKVRVEGRRITFSAFAVSLLELEVSPERSAPDRQLLYLKGGVLMAEKGGRLEFREVLDRHYVLAAIHEYNPALPWLLYKFSQAKIHLLVMRAFSRELRRSN